MIGMEQVKVLVIKQADDAASKDYEVNLGWQPDVLLVWNLKSSGRWGVAFRGVTADEDIALMDSSTAVMDHDASAGITFTSHGFKFGQNSSLFKDDEADICVIAMRSLQNAPVLKVADAGAAQSLDVGDGKQFKLPASPALDLKKGVALPLTEVSIREAS